jgi:PTH1 family peptidyl-tRNA hydrolase
VRAVVGLGNPGARYVATRHNLGFLVVDRLAVSAGAEWSADRQARSQVAEAEIGGHPVLLVKPQTFMNRSGLAVAALRERLEWTPADLLLVVDDFYLPFGRLRLRRRGSDGGHNGVASVVEALHSDDFPRLRLGIGEPPVGEDAIDYVLRPFDPSEDVAALSGLGADCVTACLREGLAAAMNRYNGPGRSGPSVPGAETSGT